MFKRIALFLATNLAVLALVSIVMSVFGLNPATNAGLLVMAFPPPLVPVHVLVSERDLARCRACASASINVTSRRMSAAGTSR